MNNDSFFFYLGVLANLCQLYDLDLNLNQTSNNQLMQELLQQDKILDKQNKEIDKQTNIYLKKIIKQNDIIIKLLSKK